MKKKKGTNVRKNHAEKNIQLRRGNVKRHAQYAARTKLREEHVHSQQVATMQMKLDRLDEASIHGNGLNQIHINRVNALKGAINKR